MSAYTVIIDSFCTISKALRFEALDWVEALT
uniref:Uncharacterized protein n=1 Tax=Arundo donax TaxID=35708 RepID=A0A0A9EAA1_ARUDO